MTSNRNDPPSDSLDTSREWATIDETDNLPRYRRGRANEPPFITTNMAGQTFATNEPPIDSICAACGHGWRVHNAEPTVHGCRQCPCRMFARSTSEPLEELLDSEWRIAGTIDRFRPDGSPIDYKTTSEPVEDDASE